MHIFVMFRILFDTMRAFQFDGLGSWEIWKEKEEEHPYDLHMPVFELQPKEYMVLLQCFSARVIVVTNHASDTSRRVPAVVGSTARTLH